MLFRSLIEHRFAATAVALVYTILALFTFATLRALGWPPPAFPPLVLAGALALDAVRRRTDSVLAIGAAFAFGFVLTEGMRLLLFVPPPPSTAVLADPQVGRLALFYWAQAAARPWLSAWPLLAIVAGAPLAAASWTVGRIVAGSLAASAASPSSARHTARRRPVVRAPAGEGKA